jgi:hypothetical protein
MAGAPVAPARAAQLRHGLAPERLTIGYNALEGVIAIVAGLAAGSVTLTGFGVDSVIEVSSGALLFWRLRAELGSASLGAAVEARATRVAGALLLALAVYIVVESGRRWAANDMATRGMVMAVSKRRSIESPSEGFPTTRRIRGVLTAILIREGY